MRQSLTLGAFVGFELRETRGETWIIQHPKQTEAPVAPPTLTSLAIFGFSSHFSACLCSKQSRIWKQHGALNSCPEQTELEM